VQRVHKTNAYWGGHACLSMDMSASFISKTTYLNDIWPCESALKIDEKI